MAIKPSIIAQLQNKLGICIQDLIKNNLNNHIIFLFTTIQTFLNCWYVRQGFRNFSAGLAMSIYDILLKQLCADVNGGELPLPDSMLIL